MATRTLNVHASDFCRLTARAEVIMLLANAYKYLFPRSSFRDIAEYLGISKDNARRYYYGVHSLNEGWNGRGCYQRMRLGSHTPYEMNKQLAIKLLSEVDKYKAQYNF